MPPEMPNANPAGGQPPSALASTFDSPLSPCESPCGQQRDTFPPAAPSSRSRPTTARLRQLKASLSAKKREANAKVDAMRKGGLARGMSMRGGRNGDGGGALLLGAPDESEEVSPDSGLAGEEMGGGSYAAPEVPTISREQWERDFANEPLRTASSGGVAADAAVPMVAKPVPVEQYNSRVGRARVANAARIHARSHACTLDPATVASMDGSQPGTVPPPAPVAVPPTAPVAVPTPAPAAVAAAAPPTSLMD